MLNIYYSELFCIGQDVHSSVDQMIQAGATHVELMLDGGFWNDFHLHGAQLAGELTKKNVQYAVHTPVWDANLTSENSLIRAAVLESYKHSIRFAALLGAHHVVIHPGFCYSTAFDKDQARSRANALLEELFLFNQGYGMQLLMENVGSNLSSLYTMQEYIHFCNQLPQLGGALVDIGHAHINGWDMEALFCGIGEKLVALHIHDNDGSSDSHSPMGEGTVSWQALAATLHRNGSHPHLILEYNTGTPLERLRQDREQLRQLFG